MELYHKSGIRPTTLSRRTNIIFLYLIVGIISHLVYSQPIENRFIDALINNKDNITDFVDKAELERSTGFGIQYTGVNHKWLISFDIPDEVKAGFKEGKLNYTLQTLQIEDGFSVVTLAVGSMNYLQKFYFLNDKFVHPSRYFTRNWKEIESRYFKFKISEPKYFNDYCVKRLDDFVDSLCTLLELEPERKNLLETKKIYYTFCIDENEVEKITGYKSKGMSVLAFDEVISAYQTHFHEVAHLLINFKLQKLGLYTLPFFMEGFAVAVGGRGGMAPRVVTDLGYFLQKTAFLTYDSILTYESFYSQDANMTYAVSGLYNRFLLDELGGKRYIELYKSLNGDIESVKKIKAGDLKLQDVNSFLNYMTQYADSSDIKLNKSDSIEIFTVFDKLGYLESSNYLFFLAEEKISTLKDSTSIVEEGYISKMFEDLTNYEYHGEKYVISTDSNYIKVSNCYNNMLIASYDINFSVEGRKVSKGHRKRMEMFPDLKTIMAADYFAFFIKKSVFDGGYKFIDVQKIRN